MLQGCWNTRQVIFDVPAVAQNHMGQPRVLQQGFRLPMFGGQGERAAVGVQEAGMGEQLNVRTLTRVDHIGVLGEATTDGTAGNQQHLFGAVERGLQCIGWSSSIGLTCTPRRARSDTLSGGRTAATNPLAGTDLSSSSRTNSPSWSEASVITIIL